MCQLLSSLQSGEVHKGIPKDEDVRQDSREQRQGMNRRELITGASAMAFSACTPSASQPTPTVDVFDGASLMKDVEAYVGFGVHRTGSEGDAATSRWFADHFRALGYTVEQTDVTCPNADTHVARLRIGEEAFDGFAQPPLVFTPEGGLTAPLVWWQATTPAKVKDAIAIVHVPRQAGAASPGAAYRQAFSACEAAGAKGIVALMSGPSGEVVAINTPLSLKPGLSILQIGEKERARLEAAMAAGAPGRLIMEGPGGDRTGVNTVATRGKAGDPWVIISTPQSGWFTCGGERGPGIAMHRALAAWAGQQTFPVRWLFIATSGHEWGDAGAEIFHHSQAPDPRETALWYHLGAGYGARAYSETPAGLLALETPNLARTLMATADLIPFCQAAFAGQPVIEKPLAADPATALGEYRLVLAESYPSAAGFWGANAHFHTPLDDASTTTPEIMSPIARAIAKVIEQKLSGLA